MCIRNLIIKYNANKKREVINRAVVLISSVIEKEKKILEKLISKLTELNQNVV
ncbi:hypothetical protein HMSSN036_53380 [Paenibacillus macerans]|nr:hypothetical protein HMSSN036_53380 [Paenibacillus macerans]